MNNATRYLVVGSLGVLMTRQDISPLAVKGLKCLTCMHAKSCIYRLTTGTEKHHTKYLIFLIFSNKNIIEDTVFIRPSFDGRIMLWRCPSVRTSVRTSVRPSVRSVVHNPCGQDIARTIWPRMLKLSMYT